MRAAIVRRFGGPEVLELVDLPVPEPGPGEVRVRVEACAVCFHDLHARAGALRHTRLPVVLGHEVAGVVAAAGPGVTGLQVGDPVVAVTMCACGQCSDCRAGQESLCLAGPGMFGEALPGGYAEFMVGPASAFVVRPPGLDAVAAACLPCAVATAHQAVSRAGLRAGETLLVTGASGGVGIHLIQLARAAGAAVLAVTTSPAKRDALLELGATAVLVSPDLDFARAARAATGGQGPDAAVDLVGGAAFTGCLRAVKRGGRVILLGDVRGEPVSFQPGLVTLKALTLMGVYAGSRADLEAAIAAQAAGHVRPVVALELPLAEAGRAHTLVQARQVLGRIVLRP